MALKDSFEKVLSQIKQQSDAYTCIAVVGQPGAGKSTLINKLLGKKVAETGSQTDVTRKITAYEYNFMKLLDVPGYGTKLFPFKKWIEDYPLDKYDAIIYVFSSKLLEEDIELFNNISIWNSHRYKPLFLVRTHSDGFDELNMKVEVEQDLHKFLHKAGVRGEKVNFVEFIYGKKDGLDELIAKIEAANLINIWKKRIEESFVRARDSYLNGCSYVASEEIDTYKKLAGANGLNPFLGADIAVDVGLYLKMFSDIRKCYGIEDNDLSLYTGFPIAKKLAELLTKQGVTILIKNFGTRFMTKNLLKYIPLAGQAASVAISWKLAKYAGDEYSDDCKKLAKDVMDALIRKEIKEL